MINGRIPRSVRLRMPIVVFSRLPRDTSALVHSRLQKNLVAKFTANLSKRFDEALKANLRHCDQYKLKVALNQVIRGSELNICRPRVI